MAAKKEVKAKAPAVAPKPEPKVEAPKQEAVVKDSVVPSGLKRVKVTQEELMKLQADNKLVGYDPATQEAIIK